MENLNGVKVVLYRRVEEECEGFQKRVLTLSSAEIVLNAYKLDCFSNICQILHEIIDNASMNELKIILCKEQILEWFYQNWLKVNDDYYQQMKESMVHILQREMTICKNAEEGKNG